MNEQENNPYEKFGVFGTIVEWWDHSFVICYTLGIVLINAVKLDVDETGASLRFFVFFLAHKGKCVERGKIKLRSMPAFLLGASIMLLLIYAVNELIVSIIKQF